MVDEKDDPEHLARGFVYDAPEDDEGGPHYSGIAAIVSAEQAEEILGCTVVLEVPMQHGPALRDLVGVGRYGVKVTLRRRTRRQNQ